MNAKSASAGKASVQVSKLWKKRCLESIESAQHDMSRLNPSSIGSSCIKKSPMNKTHTQKKVTWCQRDVTCSIYVKNKKNFYDTTSRAACSSSFPETLAAEASVPVSPIPHECKNQQGPMDKRNLTLVAFRHKLWPQCDPKSLALFQLAACVSHWVMYTNKVARSIGSYKSKTIWNKSKNTTVIWTFHQQLLLMLLQFQL